MFLQWRPHLVTVVTVVVVAVVPVGLRVPGHHGGAAYDRAGLETAELGARPRLVTVEDLVRPHEVERGHVLASVGHVGDPHGEAGHVAGTRA